MSDVHTLLPYGWNHQELPAGTAPARVIRHDGALLQIVAADGIRTIRTPAGLAVTVGDWLALDGMLVDCVLPRRSLLRRLDVDVDRAQELAANIDVVLIALGVDRPVKPGRIHRSVALAWDAGATPVIVLTKTADAAAPDLRGLRAQHPGVDVIATSALEGIGLDELRAAIGSGTAVLLGESGAGKSTLVNALLGHDVADTGGVRGDAKGRHTTTARQLHPLPGGGVIIDTPGIRAVGLFTDAAAVDAAFDDLASLADQCRFTDCGHQSEPGCAVRAAVDAGELPVERYDAWRHLQREVASAAMRATPGAQHAYVRQFGRAAKTAPKHKRG